MNLKLNLHFQDQVKELKWREVKWVKLDLSKECLVTLVKHLIVNILLLRNLSLLDFDCWKFHLVVVAKVKWLESNLVGWKRTWLGRSSGSNSVKFDLNLNLNLILNCLILKLN